MCFKANAVLALSLSAILFVVTGCESMGDMFEGTAKDLTAGAVAPSEVTSGSSSQSDSGILDFKDGEILAAYEGSTWDRANYLVATTLTAATAETKNEGEFLYITRGNSRWTPFFYETYIPDQEELEIGQWVFFCGSGRASSSPMNRDTYRKAWWYVGRITELDELFKGVVKINGDPYQVDAVRLPVEPFS